MHLQTPLTKGEGKVHPKTKPTVAGSNHFHEHSRMAVHLGLHLHRLRHLKAQFHSQESPFEGGNWMILLRKWNHPCENVSIAVKRDFYVEMNIHVTVQNRSSEVSMTQRHAA